MLLSELRTRVRFKVSDSSEAGVTTRWSDTEIDYALEEATRKIQSELSGGQYHWLFRKSHAFSTESDKEVYSLPPDVRHIVAVRRTDLGDEHPRLRPINEELRARFRFGTSPITITAQGNTFNERAEVARRYYLKDNRIGIVPIPDDAFDIRVDYVRRLRLPQKDNDRVELPDEALNPTMVWAAVVLLENSDEDAGALRALYAQYISDMRQDMNNRITNQTPPSKRSWDPAKDLTNYFA